MPEDQPQQEQQEKRGVLARIKERAAAIRQRIPVIRRPEKTTAQELFEAQRREERQRRIAEQQEKLRRIKEQTQARIRAAEERVQRVGRPIGERIRRAPIYAGVRIGAQEARERFRAATYRAGVEVGRLPYTLAERGYGFARERAIAVREQMRMRPGVPTWHAGLLYQPGARPYRPLARLPGVRPVRVRVPGVPTRARIPKGTIKAYWSKKVKKLARLNVKRFGVEEGLAKTRQVADMLGWKMQ